MIIIETCPICGHDLFEYVAASNPPIRTVECPSCGWIWTAEREEVIRVPFGGNSLSPDDLASKLQDYTVLNATLDDSVINNFSQTQCISCQSNPKNGGDAEVYLRAIEKAISVLKK